ncbi:MAG: alpha/beta fold hydrolase [Deltaproteobacteria bacterium]|nr:alpha/beta fold hydrolase [Deltaproteobacteria bacterium]MCL5791761.1 alpha/beta fold hydrolase [Deltaproteobacteria bacterium]
MILLHILVWLFVFLFFFVGIQFIIAVYDNLNFQDHHVDRGIDILTEFIKEVFITWFVFVAYVIGFFNYDSLLLRRTSKHKTPIILVHGYTMNRACFLLIHIRLFMDGFRVFTVNLYPPFKRIESLSELLADKVDEIAEKTGEREVYIIGHSMGGLVARYYSSSPRGMSRVKKIITIATPHNGTRTAALGIGMNANEMKPGAAFLETLQTRHHAPLYAIWSIFDNMVVPPQTGYLKDYPNSSVQFKGHITMLYSSAVYKLIFNEIKEL